MPIVINPDEIGPLRGAFAVKVILRGEDTGGVMAAIEETIPPGVLIAPHTHDNDVWVYVLSGEVGVLVADDIEVATAGQWALKPRSVPHAMWNATREPARIIEVLTPPGSERWFEELAALPNDDNGGFERLCRQYGITFLQDSPWTEQIRERFGVS